ncbi:unnamed protein product [Moneuplotes crassus]|uniref:Uncharacterized protein n=1 Tax=Euplotes crassus TaxID=5936 RepID=A0AAD1Y090_EUPCR|nr:unnamed protein product [Moneuplotes crassus]
MDSKSDKYKEMGFRNIKPHLSLENGKFSQSKIQTRVSLAFIWISAYWGSFVYTPARNKVYTSIHPPFLFAGALYLPYRYSAQVNTFLFALSGSKNLWVNRIVRVCGKASIYSLAALSSLVISHYLHYPRKLYKASFIASWNVIKIKKFIDEEEYDRPEVFDMNRINFVT